MTQSVSEPKTLSVTADDRRVARLAALAIVLALIDASIPSPLPGVEPGLANIVVLFALYRYGWRVAVSVSLLRVFGAALVIGTMQRYDHLRDRRCV